MNDVLQSSILRVLARWGALPETDLLRWLPPEQAVDFGAPVLEAMAAAGLILVRQIGDERVIRLTDRGRAEAGASQPSTRQPPTRQPPSSEPPTSELPAGLPSASERPASEPPTSQPPASQPL